MVPPFFVMMMKIVDHVVYILEVYLDKAAWAVLKDKDKRALQNRCNNVLQLVFQITCVGRTHEPQLLSFKDTYMVFETGNEDTLDVPLLACAFIPQLLDPSCFSVKTYRVRNYKGKVIDDFVLHTVDMMPTHMSAVSFPSVIALIARVLLALDFRYLDPAHNVGMLYMVKRGQPLEVEEEPAEVEEVEVEPEVEEVEEVDKWRGCFRPLMAGDYKQNGYGKGEKQIIPASSSAKLLPRSINDVTGYWVRYAMAHLLVANDLTDTSVTVQSIRDFIRDMMFGHKPTSQEIESTYSVNKGRLLYVAAGQEGGTADGQRVPADGDFHSSSQRERLLLGLKYKSQQLKQTQPNSTCLSVNGWEEVDKVTELLESVLYDKGIDVVNTIYTLNSMLPRMEPFAPLRLDLDRIDFGDIFGDDRIPVGWKNYLESRVEKMHVVQKLDSRTGRGGGGCGDGDGAGGKIFLRDLGDTVLFRNDMQPNDSAAKEPTTTMPSGDATQRQLLILAKQEELRKLMEQEERGKLMEQEERGKTVAALAAQKCRKANELQMQRDAKDKRDEQEREETTLRAVQEEMMVIRAMEIRAAKPKAAKRKAAKRKAAKRKAEETKVAKPKAAKPKAAKHKAEETKVAKRKAEETKVDKRKAMDGATPAAITNRCIELVDDPIPECNGEEATQISVYLSAMEKDACHLSFSVDGKCHNVLVVLVKKNISVSECKYILEGWYYKPPFKGWCYKPPLEGEHHNEVLLTRKRNVEKTSPLSGNNFLVALLLEREEEKTMLSLTCDQLKKIEEAIRGSQAVE